MTTAFATPSSKNGNQAASRSAGIEFDPNTCATVGELLAAIAAGRITPELAAPRLAALTRPARKGGKNKTPSALTRAHFREHAQEVQVEIAGVPLLAGVKEFSSGSLGWYANGKLAVKVGDVAVQVQVGVNMTIVGSKELAQG